MFEDVEPMPEEVIRAIMQQRNKRTGKNFTRDEAEAVFHSAKKRRPYAARTSIVGFPDDYQDSKGRHWHYENGKLVED